MKKVMCVFLMPLHKAMLQRGTDMSLFLFYKSMSRSRKKGSGLQLMKGLSESGRGANRRGGDGKLPLAPSSTEIDGGKLQLSQP